MLSKIKNKVWRRRSQSPLKRVLSQLVDELIRFCYDLTGYQHCIIDVFYMLFQTENCSLNFRDIAQFRFMQFLQAAY